MSMGAVDAGLAVLFFLLAYGYGLLFTACTLPLGELSYRRYPGSRDRLLLLLWTLIEDLGYRQMTVCHEKAVVQVMGRVRPRARP